MIATELVDHILSFLHSEEDYTTLTTCSLTFPQIADRHLYSHITFFAPDPIQNNPMTSRQAYFATRTNGKGTHVVHPTLFSHLLVNRPHIANCVRVLRIIASTGDSRASDQSTVLLPVIASILSDLSHVESIAFNSRRLLSWSTLDPAFCTALQRCIRLPSVKRVAISEINGFPPDTFHSCENLSSLQLYNQCTAAEPDLSGIVPWMRNNTLHTLSLSIFDDVNPFEALPGFWTLINACSASLVRLELDHTYCSSFETLHHASVFPKLRLPFLDHITLRFPVLMPFHKCFLPLFASFLGSIQTISSLSPIRLTLHLQFRRDGILILGLGEPLVPDWSFIANVLVLPIFRHPVEFYIDQVN